jgi:hypothetical protein
MIRLSAKEIMDKQDAGITLFIRWSRGPEYDKQASRDYINGGAHAGLSAVQLGMWDEPYMIRRLNEYRFLQMKDAEIKPYIYTGDVVGLDSDGYESVNVESAVCVGIWNEN